MHIQLPITTFSREFITKAVFDATGLTLDPEYVYSDTKFMALNGTVTDGVFKGTAGLYLPVSASEMKLIKEFHI